MLVLSSFNKVHKTVHKIGRWEMVYRTAPGIRFQNNTMIELTMESKKKVKTFLELSNIGTSNKVLNTACYHLLKAKLELSFIKNVNIRCGACLCIVNSLSASASPDPLRWRTAYKGNHSCTQPSRNSVGRNVSDHRNTIHLNKESHMYLCMSTCMYICIHIQARAHRFLTFPALFSYCSTTSSSKVGQQSNSSFCHEEIKE